MGERWDPIEVTRPRCSPPRGAARGARPAPAPHPPRGHGAQARCHGATTGAASRVRRDRCIGGALVSKTPVMQNGARTSYHVCPLCEATCGLAIRTRGREVVGIRGDEADVFSRGFICPKGYALKEL